MTGFIFGLTLRQFLGRKSTLIQVGLALIPVLLAIVYRLNSANNDPEQWTVQVLFNGLITSVALPLTALLFGTSVLGDEIEEGTAVYLLTKPLERWQILAAKLAASTLITAVLAILSTLLSGLIALDGQASLQPLVGFSVAVLVGSLAYTAVFILLSLVTSRALIAGLIYVFIWEAAVSAIFTGTRYLSIRHYILALAKAISNISPTILDEKMGGPTAVILVSITTVGAIVLANRRLRRLEVREST